MGTACSCTHDGDSGFEKDSVTEEVNSSKMELIDEQTLEESVESHTKTNCLHNNHISVEGNHKSIINQPRQTVIENSNDNIKNVRNFEHSELNGHVVPIGNPLSAFSPMGPVGANENLDVKIPNSSSATILIPEDDLTQLVNLAPLIKQAKDLISNATSPKDQELVTNMTTELASLVSRLEQAVIRLEKAGGPGTANRIAQSTVPSSSQAKKSSSTSKPAASNLRYDAAHYVYNYDAPWLSGKEVTNGHAEVAPQVNFGDSNNVDNEPAMCTWGEESSTPYIVAWDDMMNGPFKSFMDKSKIIGGDVETIAKLVEGCFLTQRAFLICATKSNKPSEADFPKLLEPTGKKIQAVVEFRESNRSSRFFNHLSAVSEAIPALSWVTVEPAPSPFIKEMGDAGTFYTNRILKEYKDKDRTHVGWTQDWIGIFKEMQSHVKQYHTTGVSWNPKGGRALDNLKEAPQSAGVPPPPPPGCPPPPPPPPMMTALAKSSTVDDRAALFAELNKGTAVTAGLKKVTSDMQTHKNPSLREGPKPFVKQSSPAASTTPAKQKAPEKPPRFELEGRKWFVEYQKNNKNIIIDDTSMDQTVYIFRCEGSIVQVKGKLNNIILDSCKKTSLVFDKLVSCLEVVNCQSAEVQVLGTLPSCSIEKTDGCQLYLSKDSIGLEVVTSKSTTMNLLVPKDDGQFTELPIPEQFKTQIKNGKLETQATEIAG